MGKVNSLSKKRIVCGIVADIRIAPTAFRVWGDKVVIQLPAVSLGRDIRKLLVVDHRPSVLRVARRDPADRFKMDSSQDAFVRAELVRRVAVSYAVSASPARIVVKETKLSGRAPLYCVELFHADGENPTALFSENVYNVDCLRRRGIGSNKAIWSWEARRFIRNSRRRTVLVALTDERRNIVINGPTSRRVTIIGRRVEQIKKEGGHHIFGADSSSKVVEGAGI